MKFPAIAASLLAAALMSSCKHEPGVVPIAATESDYPDHIRALLVNRCATAGCHNDASAINSKGLNLTSWSKLFSGASSGSVVVPFSAENSSLLQFVNTYADLGPQAKPAMPYNPADPDVPISPLSREEFTALRDWIAAGAPNKQGEFPFGSATDTRQKIYCTMQGCDLLGVIDAATGLVMRYIPIGKSAAVESPHCVRVSPDGRYAYVSFISSNWVQKINTSTDQIEAEIDLGQVDPPRTLNGKWNVLHLSADGERFVVTNWAGDGHLVVVTTDDMKVQYFYGGNNSQLLKYPHGIAAVPTFDTFFVTAEYGNVIHKFSPNGVYFDTVSIDGAPPTWNALTRDPHEIIFSPDGSKYFLSCQASNEVRVMDARADTLIIAIPVGTRPREMDISRNPATPYLFVTCEEDVSSTPLMRGSVYVIDYNAVDRNTTGFVAKLEDGRFAQPHGIAVDDRYGMLYVASRNATTNGPAPHHASSCTGRNGWYTMYKLSTLKPANGKRFEVSVEPYSMDARFKGPN